jgi:hypothetical protein
MENEEKQSTDKGYKIRNKEGIHFITFVPIAIGMEWVDVFTRGLLQNFGSINMLLKKKHHHQGIAPQLLRPKTFHQKRTATLSVICLHFCGLKNTRPSFCSK